MQAVQVSCYHCEGHVRAFSIVYMQHAHLVEPLHRSLVKGVVLDYVRISHSDDLPQMLSVANVQFIQ